MSVTGKVCPRCGAPATGTPRLCIDCGLDLGSQYRLPTRAEWVSRRLRPEDAGPAPGSGESGGASPAPALARSAPGRPLLSTRQRDVLLGAGGVTFAVGQLLATVAALLLLLETIHLSLLPGLKVGHGLDLAAQIAELAGLAVLASGFLVDDDRRWSRLGSGAVLVAIGAAFEFAGVTTIAVEFLVHHGPGKLSASYIVKALAAIPLLAGALIAWRAFAARSGEPVRQAYRDRRLAETSGALAGSAVLLAAAAILVLDLYSGISTVPGGYLTALGFEIAGQFIIAAALLVAVVAFSRRGQSDVARTARRDGLLWIAAAVAFAGYLMQFIAGVAAISSASGGLLGGKDLTAAWLTTFQDLAASGALICAGIGLFMSARARR